MRIAYIAPYQGPSLVKKRPSLHNLSLGGTTKIELIAELLQKNGHQVEILAQGEVIHNAFKLYPSFSESQPFSSSVPINYASSFPVRFLNGKWSSLSMLRIFKARHRHCRFDLVLIYNLKPPQVACAQYAIRRLGLPVVLEYEDDYFGAGDETVVRRFTSRFFSAQAKRLLHSLSGCLSNSPALLAQVPENAVKLVLCGVVSEAIVKLSTQPASERKNWVVFSGTHSKAQGLEQLITAWNVAKLPGWELHIAGHGSMTAILHEMAKTNPTIVFRGLLNRHENALLLASGKIAAVPYDVSTTLGFSFKTVECLAAGLHVVTTPLAALNALSAEIKKAITYIPNNAPETIATNLKSAIAERRYERTAIQPTLNEYGPSAVARTLETFLQQVMAKTLRSA